MFIINKEIKIVNPTELKSSDSPPEFTRENYSIYNNTNCSNNLPNINEFKLLSEMNYIEKCTIELDFIRSKFPCDYYTYHTFEFSFNCSEKYPYEIVETQTCVEYCDENSLSSGKCKLNYNYSKKIYDLLNEILNEKKNNDKNFIENIQKIFSDGSINNILDNILDVDKDITISNNETIIQITSTDNQRNSKNHNISTINLGICEETLKKVYKIDQNKSLLILKIDTFIAGSKIPVIEYEVYHPDNKGKLNLSFCNNKSRNKYSRKN